MFILLLLLFYFYYLLIIGVVDNNFNVIDAGKDINNNILWKEKDIKQLCNENFIITVTHATGHVCHVCYVIYCIVCLV